MIEVSLKKGHSAISRHQRRLFKLRVAYYSEMQLIKDGASLLQFRARRASLPRLSRVAVDFLLWIVIRITGWTEGQTITDESTSRNISYDPVKALMRIAQVYHKYNSVE